MSEWKDCGHCDSPAEHALHLKLHEVECRLFESERRLEALQYTVRALRGEEGQCAWFAGTGTDRPGPRCVLNEGHVGMHNYWTNVVERQSPECAHDWDYATKLCRKCGKAAKALGIEFGYPNRVIELDAEKSCHWCGKPGIVDSVNGWLCEEHSYDTHKAGVAERQENWRIEIRDGKIQSE